MRLAPAIAAIPLLIAMLTWMSLEAFNGKAEQFDQALEELDRFAMQEAALQRDVLSARTGILRDYDPLVREIDGLYASVGRLREIAATDGTIEPPIDRLDESLVQQENLVERFKTNNALLQNSLAYFTLFSTHLNASDSVEPLAPAISALASAMLRLTLDTSAASAEAVQEQLDRLAGQHALDGDTLVQPLLAHGRLLHQLLPSTDNILRSFFATSLRPEQADLHGMILKRQSESRAAARAFRMYLYFTSLLLVLLLAYVGMQLRARARDLRRRAAFEHIIAGISISFVGARTQDLDLAIHDALATMGRHLGAQRAYFLASSPSARTYTWCEPGMAFPSGWPDRALSMADRCHPTTEGIVHVPHLRQLRSAEDRAALTSMGVQGWACIVRTDESGGRALLGFDAVTHSWRIGGTSELGLLLMGLDAIGNALDRRAIEQERARLDARLQQARRLETIGAFASGIAHNFNNILGAILGYTEMADEPSRAGGRHPAILQEIRRAGERARELVDQILMFARRRDAPPRPVHMGTLVTETVSLLRASLPATVELVVHGASDAVVLGVSAQLQQVILNLCTNAAQAMSNAGRVELDVDAPNVANEQSLSHGALSPGPYVRVAVTDDGAGIDGAVLERIFEPFFTTRWNGNGLGLATTRDIVAEHGGAMHVRSALGVGTSFEVWLPRAFAAASPPEEDGETLPLGTGETILMLEEGADRLLRDEEILAALGYEPVGFTRAEDAEAACRTNPERFDALVVSHGGQMTSALHLAAVMHRAAPALPILLATPSSDGVGANALTHAGVSDVLRWPISAMEIAASLHAPLSGARRRRVPAQ